MRASRWLVGSFGGAVVAIAGVGGGCSSTSSPPAAPDAAASDAACYVDASLRVFAASDAAGADCAACVQANCQPAIAGCATDCACIDFFGCVAEAGTISTGLSRATQAAAAACAGSSLLLDPGLDGLLQCFQGPCQSVCSADASPEGPSDAEANDAADATVTDAARVIDAETDAPDGS